MEPTRGFESAKLLSMKIFRIMIFVSAAAVAALLSVGKVVAQEDSLGTAAGIPNSSPGVLWPRGSSVETLGFGKLYPNGPDFGLSNTSGGFGTTGSGRMSGVGLAERSVSPLVQEQLERPYNNIQRLNDDFTRESAKAQSTFSDALSGQFRTEIQRGSVAPAYQPSSGQLIRPYALPSVDSVLQDGAPSPDGVLKTGL